MKLVKRIQILCLFCFITLCLGVAGSMASDDVAIDVFHDVRMEGLSLKSTAEEINSFITSQSYMNCEHVDVPAKVSKSKKRPSVPRRREWHCMSSDIELPGILEIQMYADVLTYINYEKRYKTEQSQNNAVQMAINTFDKLKKAGLSDEATDKDNYVSYYTNDIIGKSDGAFMHSLKSRIRPVCDGTAAYFNLLMTANKIPEKSVYSARMQLERNHFPLNCAR